MFNRSQIMKAAWAEVRRRRTFNGKFHFCRKTLADAMKKAWLNAKQAAGVLTAAEIAKADQAQAVRRQIEMLSYRTLRYDVGAQRRHLEAQLSALAA